MLLYISWEVLTWLTDVSVPYYIFCSKGLGISQAITECTEQKFLSELVCQWLVEAALGGLQMRRLVAGEDLVGKVALYMLHQQGEQRWEPQNPIIQNWTSSYGRGTLEKDAQVSC